MISETISCRAIIRSFPRFPRIIHLHGDFRGYIFLQQRLTRGLSLSIHYLYIASGREFARAADRLKAIRRLAFPGGARGRGKREQLPVFSGRLDLMIFSSVTRERFRGATDTVVVYTGCVPRSVQSALTSLRRRPFFGESFIPRLKEKYKSPVLAIKFPSDVSSRHRDPIIILNKIKFNCIT